MNHLLFSIAAVTTTAVFSFNSALARESEHSTGINLVNVVDASDSGYDDSIVADACCTTGCNCCCDSPWTARAGWVYLERSEPSSQEIINFPTGTPLLNASDFDFGFEPGFEVSLTRHVNSCWDIEGRYLQVDGWQADGRVDYTGPLAAGDIATNPATEFYARTNDYSTFTYKSQLRSAELTLWRRFSSRVRLGAGFRWIEFNDRLSSDTLFERTPISVPMTFSFDAKNDLYGFQLTGEVLAFSRRRLRIEAIGKAGIYGLDARAAAALEQQVVDVRASGSDSRSAAAFVGELGFLGTAQLTRRWSIICGYQLLWLEGIALATDQLDNTGSLNAPVGVPVVTPMSLDTGGGIFAHGATVALEFRR